MCKFINLTLREIESNSEIISGTLIKGYYKIVSVEVKKTNKEAKYIMWLLTDASGIKKTLRTNWTYEEKLLTFSSGMIVQVVATINLYNNNKELVLEQGEKGFFIRIPTDSEIQGMSFIPEENNSLSKVEIFNYVSEVKDEELRKLLEIILSDNEMIFAVPASKNYHHVSVGGLARYILDVLEIALLLAKQQSKANIDIIIVGIILANIGKVKAIDINTSDYTPEYRMLGSNGLSMNIVSQYLPRVKLEEKTLLVLWNIIYSKNTDEKEPLVSPMTLESHIIHAASTAVAGCNSVSNLYSQDGTVGDITNYSKMHKQFFYKGI